jgi:PAS domain S-box-containing protein
MSSLEQQIAKLQQELTQERHLRQQAQVALQESRLTSEQRYAALTQAVPVGIFRTDTEGHCLYVNDRWCQITGLTLLEAQNEGWAKTLHPDDRDRIFVEWYDCAKKNLPFRSEYRFQQPNGTTTWVIGEAIEERGIDGELLGYIGSITDISEAKRAEVIRTQAESDLIESEQKFRAIFDGTFQFIGLLTPEGRVTEANRTALEAIAVKLEDVVGKLFWATPWWTHSPILQGQLKDAIDRAATGELVRFEAEHILANGKSVFVDFSLTPVLDDEDGTVIMLIPEGRDISDRKHKEEMLRNLSLGVSTKTDALLFQALTEYLTKSLGVDYAMIAELIQSENQRVQTIAIYGNGQILENFEYDLAHTPCELVIDQQRCVYPDQIQQHFPFDPFLKAIQAESYMGMPLFDSTGRVVGLIAVLSRQPWHETQPMVEILNIFAARAAAELERQQAEAELQRQKQDLARSNAELQQFAYVASHDLQEPLRMVTSYLELLERRYHGQLDPKADQFIAYAVDGAVRMQTLINALLSYSRIGSREQLFQPVNGAEVLQDVLTNLQVTIEQNNAQITHDRLPLVSGDRTQLTQLFQNIINNGIKFRRAETPHIHIGVTRSSDKWLFSIRDNGIGIEDQYLDRIFVIFQRLHSRSEYPGTGIGLAICKKIVERHGGMLWVESQTDEPTNRQMSQGSTFYFTLPRTTSF